MFSLSNDSNNSYNLRDVLDVSGAINMKNASMSMELQGSPNKTLTRPKPNFSFDSKPGFFLDLKSNSDWKMIDFSKHFGLFPNEIDEFT